MAALITTIPLPAFSSDSEYVEMLVHEAKQRRLHEERAWKTLLHYGKSFTGADRSKIDDRRFFNAPDGRTNPEAELESTLRSFFAAETRDNLSTACRFPARYAWLGEQLHIDVSRLPAASCSERDRVYEAIEPRSAVLVFPVGHINSPASMFGHTLIRIDGTSKSSLISYAVNYSAENTDSNGIAYAWKGLTGMYKGFYSLMPYYDKVREYSNLEHRDMWEYRLKLTVAETRRMLDHIWELQHIESSYYFLDENCSYNLMFLIEAARPELHLTDRTGTFVLPSDTIRLVMDNGIVEEVAYRPSQGTKLRNMLGKLDPGMQGIARDISYGLFDPARVRQLPVSAVEQIRILDLATGFVQFRYGRKELEKDVYSRLYLAVLRERSTLGAAPDNLYQSTEPARPDTGHGSTRISAAAGVRRGELYGELNIRPEFHALLDPDQGYLPGAQINFMDTAVRYGGGSNHLYLKSLHALDIVSIAPRDTFFKPWSWKVNTGADRVLLRDGDDHLIYRLNTGGGLAYASPFGGTWYALAELDVNAGPKLRAGITAGPGISIGTAEKLSGRTKLLLNISGYRYVIGDDRTALMASLGLNRQISQHNSLSIESSLEAVNSRRISEIALRWNWYY